MWKNYKTYSSINVRHEVVVCVSIYSSKCNNIWIMVSISSMDDSTHAKMLIIQEM